MGMGSNYRRKTGHLDFVDISDFLEVIEEINISKKEARDLLGIGWKQFRRWELKGKMPSKYFWNFQNALAMFLQEEMIRKMARIGLLSKDLINDIKE